MSDIIEPFKREVRYEVIKIKTGQYVNDCVVVERDWPEYEIVWRMLQDRMEGKPDNFAAEIRKEQDAKIAMCVEAILELKYSNTTEVANRKANNALSASEQDVAKFIAKFEAKSDRLADSNYIAGMKAGWNFCAEGDSAGFEKAIDTRVSELAAEKRAK